MTHPRTTRALALCFALFAACSRGERGDPASPAPSTTRAEAAPSLAPRDPLTAIARRAEEALSPESRAAVAVAPWPVLLFSDPSAAAASAVTAGPAWYAISARAGERTLSLHVVGEARSASAPVGHVERVRGGAPAMVLYNEGVRSVTWSERGATYALEVECARPFDDEACTQATYVLGLAESLVAAPSRVGRDASSVTRASTVGGAL